MRDPAGLGWVFYVHATVVATRPMVPAAPLPCTERISRHEEAHEYLTKLIMTKHVRTNGATSAPLQKVHFLSSLGRISPNYLLGDRGVGEGSTDSSGEGIY